MDIKALLLAGCGIKMGYKRCKTDWVGEVCLTIYAGGNGIAPKVCMHGDWINTDYAMADIDQAIEDFKTKVFCPKNLWYKHDEAMILLSTENPDIDLDDEDDFEIYEAKRQELINTTF